MTRIKQALLEHCLNWFLAQFRENVVQPIELQFPNFSLPSEIQAVLQRTEVSVKSIRESPATGDGTIDLLELIEARWTGDANQLQLFKQIILRFRRWRASYTEGLTEKTSHLELAETLEEDVKVLDVLTTQDWFLQIEPIRLPRPKDFLPVQFIEQSTSNKPAFPERHYDEKFHILQAPNLFLPDVAYFRAKCEDREVPLAVAFLDIDNFKSFNTKHTEPKVDRNLLPRFMQTLEAHVFHHGYAYRQGGDEYLILVPSLSKNLSITFMDELRCKLAELKYPEIDDQTTASIGLCIVESDCPLTDRELRDRASQAKRFAKEKGKNCIAMYDGSHLAAEELRIVKP